MTNSKGNDPNLARKFDKSLSLLCWAYNEEDSIGEYLERALSLMDSCVEDYEIVLIDDGSTDQTYAIAESFRSKTEKLKIFRNETNLNVGFSSRRAIGLASKEYLFWQTVDWSYDISDLRRNLEYLREWDIVQGVRREPVQVRIRFLKPFVALLKIFGMKYLTKRSDTVPKALVSVINYLLIRLLFQIPLSDFQNVTIYPTRWIQSIAFEAESSFVSPEGMIKSHWNGMSIKEVPISFIPRRKGEGKGTRIPFIVKSVSDILYLWFKWIVLRKRHFVKSGKIGRLGVPEREQTAPTRSAGLS
jgi:glycosyltransferase involved in cell wall biosynthesis